MRALALTGLALAVALAHLAGWWIAVREASPSAAPRAGVHWLALVAAAPAPAPTPVPRTRESGPSPRFEATPRPHGIGPPSPRATPRGADARSPAPGGPAWPRYPTRAPPPATLRYALAQLGPAAVGEAELAWSRDAAGFTLRLATLPAGRAPRQWISTGGFDAAGLAPTRLAERERGRDRRAIDLDQAAGELLPPGAKQPLALAPGAQDRWSWVAQLAAIVEAAPTPVTPGTQWRLQVAGLRGDLDTWVFRVLSADAAPPPELAAACARDCGLLHVLREPARPYELRVEAWLARRLHHLPAGLRMSTPPSSWALALWLRDPA